MVTPQGRDILDQMVTVGRGLNEIILAGLAPAEIEAAERALEVMKDNIRRAVVERDDSTCQWASLRRTRPPKNSRL